MLHPNNRVHNEEMVTLDALRSQRREEVLRLAAQWGARSVRVFGSVARGDADENSDLDLLVDWEPERSLLDHAGLVQDLQGIARDSSSYRDREIAARVCARSHPPRGDAS